MIWDLDLIGKYKSVDDVKKELEAINKRVDTFVKKWKENTQYQTDANKLLEAIVDYEDLQSAGGTVGDVGYRFWLEGYIDSENKTLKSWNGLVEANQISLYNKIIFFELALGKISKENQSKFLEEKSLEKYHEFLKIIFDTAKYNLTEKEEAIIGSFSQTTRENWIKMISDYLSKESVEIGIDGKMVEKTFSELSSITSDRKQENRDNAAKAINITLEKIKHFAESEINSLLRTHQINDEIRGIERPDLPRHLSDGIESEVVDTMIETVSKNFDTAKEYYKYKATLLGKEKLAYHERNVPIGKSSKKYPFEESLEIVKQVFTGLDKEFTDVIEDAFREKRIDATPRKGKTGGAFCANNTINQPIYVLLNHTNKLNDVLTIAHEFGHAIHFTLSKVQNELNYGMSLATAEVASTFFEDFVLEELLNRIDSVEEKRHILMQKLNDDISTIHRQVACYNFEKELHSEFRKSGYLPADRIGEIFQENMKAYMGEGVNHEEGTENWWIAWSHIRNHFYVYSYASGLLISKALQNMVRKDKKNIEKVKTFLSSGVSKSPKDLFLDLGIDVTSSSFWEAGLEEVNNLLTEVKELD